MADNFRIAGFLPKQLGADPEEELRKRLDSLSRVQSGTSPIRDELYKLLFETGPDISLKDLDRDDPATSILASLKAPDRSALDTAANARGVAELDSERVNKPFTSQGGFDWRALQGISGKQPIGSQLSDIMDASIGSSTFDPNRVSGSPYDEFFADASGAGDSPLGQQVPSARGIPQPQGTPQSSPSPQIPTKAPFLDSGVQAGNVSPQLTGFASGAPGIPESDLDVSLRDRIGLSADSGALGGILKALGSNAGLSALGIGAQGIGSLLEGRAQSKADKRTSKQQKVNNAIAAFTGGGAEQAASERGSSAGGGLLKALGQGLGGFAQGRAVDQARSDILSQQDVENTRAGQERDDAVAQQGVTNAQTDRKLNLIEAEQGQDFEIGLMKAINSGKEAGETGKSNITTARETFNVYMGALDRAEVKGVGANFLTDLPLIGRMFPEGQAAKTLSEAVALNLAVAIQGSRPSEGDRIAFALLLPDMNDSKDTMKAKERNLNELLDAAQGLRAQGVTQSGGWVSAYNSGGIKALGGQGAGGAISAVDEALIDRALAGDETALQEARDKGLI
tara:strand:- start:2049 stop:3746 length:1698 start_codon:yes stop_codon:yes gene_type:complete